MVTRSRTLGSGGLELIKKFEGLYLKAYKCPAGVRTIGYGHTNGVSADMTITEAQATQFLLEDVASSEKYVNKQAMSFEPNQNEFDALVSFTFNCGCGNLAKLVNGRSKQQVADSLLLYNKGGGKVLKGLERRRKEERELFLK